MQISSHVEELQRQLLSAAAPGTAEARDLAERLASSIDAAARLAILQALSDAAGEITRELAPGSVDVRLRGRDVEFVVARPEEPAGPAAPLTPGPAQPSPPRADGVEDDDAATSRTTLRLPDALKARAESAAAAEGVSLNAWLVRAVTAALDPRPVVRETRGSTYTGWVR